MSSRVPSSPAASDVHAVDHVAIAVRDADEAARTFTRLLGWSVVHDEIVAAAGGGLSTSPMQRELPEPWRRNCNWCSR